MEVPIRYASGDPVERWLNETLCLTATLAPHPSPTCPAPAACELSAPSLPLHFFPFSNCSARLPCRSAYFNCK